MFSNLIGEMLLFALGEYKRVAIGCELLDEPSLLVLDDPTVGLDSTLACELLCVLQKLARAGRTVICAIKQPTSQVGLLLRDAVYDAS